MKKIIKGKVYDTDTAKEIGFFSNTDSRRDFHWCEEKLYLKRTGEYFLYGEGGPKSKYAQRVDFRTYSEGSDIFALTFEEAREWAEEHLSAEEYIEAFGAEEDDSMQYLHLRLPASLISKIRMEASKSGMSASKYMEDHFKNM